MVVSLLLTVAACSNKPTRLQSDISEGLKPTVSVIVAARDGINTRYLGAFALKNGNKRHKQVAKSVDSLTEQLEDRIRADAVVTPVVVPRDAKDELVSLIDSPIHLIDLSYMAESDVEVIGSWSHAEDVDYLIFVLPFPSGNPFHNKTGSVKGGGLLVIDEYYRTSFIVGSYEVVVFDTQKSRLFRGGSRVLFNQVRNYGVEALSPKRLKAVEQKYQMDVWSHRYATGSEPESIEERIRRAKLFVAKDFNSLPQEILIDIEQKVRRLEYLAIEDILAEVGVLKEARKYDRLVNYIATTEDVHRRFVPIYRQRGLSKGLNYWEIPE